MPINNTTKKARHIMFPKIVSHLVRILSFLTTAAFIAVSVKIWYPIGLWSPSGIDWDYVFFAVLVHTVEIVIYFAILKILWTRGTIVVTQTDKRFVAAPVFTELIKMLGEVFAVIIVQAHVIFAIAKLFEAHLQIDLANIVLPGFIQSFYDRSEAYLFGDFHFIGEAAFVPIAIIVVGTLLALSELFISYRCSALFKE
jgi:hypothetical protein